MRKNKILAMITSATTAMTMTMSVPINASAASYAQPPAVELYETYTFDKFLKLDDETVLEIHRELVPEIDAAAKAEAVKAAGEAAIANGEIIISGCLPQSTYGMDIWSYALSPADIFSIDTSLPDSSLKDRFTYEIDDIGGEEYVEFEVELISSDSHEFTADEIYRVYVWLSAQPEAAKITVEDTSYTSCGLTKEELYAKYDFDAIMKLKPETICSFSKEIKEQYEDIKARTAFYGFTGYYSVDFTEEYKADIPFYTDPVTAREIVIEETGIDKVLCWGIVTPYNETNGTTGVSLYFHEDKLTSYAELYELERTDFIARLCILLSLNPNVEGVLGGIPHTAPTGITPDMIHYNYEFDEIVNMDMKEIFDLVMYTPLLYVDALAYARDNGFDEYTDLTDYSFILKSASLNSFYDPDDLSGAFKMLYISDYWLKDGRLISKGDLQYQLIISDAFVNDYLNYDYDYDNITLFASIYLWLTSGTQVEDFTIEVNDEPDVSEMYTFEQFLELSEEKIIALTGEAKPMFEPQSYCDYVKSEALKTLENNALEMSVYVSEELLFELFPFGSGSGSEYLISECGLPETLISDAVKGYTTYEWDGAVYHEVKVEFSVDEVLAYPYKPENLIYRLAAWLYCDDRIIDVRVIDTDYISIGLTEAEIYEKYTFEDIMTLSSEEICGFTEELKEMYIETVNAARSLSFNREYNINFTPEYQNTVDVPYFDDPVAARRMLREELRIPEELYWGIITPQYSGSNYPDIRVYIKNDNLEEFTARYSCDEAEVAARLLVWLNLNPNVRASGGYTPEGVAGGVYPLYMYENMGFDEVIGKDIKEIFTLPYDASLYYVDALETAQEMGINDETDLCGYTFKVQMYPFKDYYTDGVFTNYAELYEMLHITEDWLAGGSADGPYDDAENDERIWFSINLDEDFYDSYISQGYSSTDIFATIYMWLDYKDAVYKVSVGTNESYEPPAVKCGEVNRDGKISIADIIVLSKYNAGIITLNETQLRAADCTNDGVVNGNDLYALMMYIVELTDVLPIVLSA